MPTASAGLLTSSSSGRPSSAHASTFPANQGENVSAVKENGRGAIVSSARRRYGSSSAAVQPSPHASKSASGGRTSRHALCAEQPPSTLARSGENGLSSGS